MKKQYEKPAIENAENNMIFLAKQLIEVAKTRGDIDYTKKVTRDLLQALS